MSRISVPLRLFFACAALAAAPLAAQQPIPLRQERAQEEKQCLDVLPPEMRARFDRPLSQVPLDIRVADNDWLPSDCSLVAFGAMLDSGEFGLMHRPWAEAPFVWEAAN